MSSREVSSKKRSVILLSGGLDSSANLALARMNDDPVLAITFQYGQRADQAELKSASALCSFFDVPHEVVNLSWLGKLGKSALTDSYRAMPKLQTSELDTKEKTEASAEQVWVPNRNAVFLSVGTAYAEKLGADRVVLGFNREEGATFPDNTESFLQAASALQKYSTRTCVEAFSYTTALDKREIVELIRRVRPDFPWNMVWSCYERGPLPCGECESCLRFQRATQ